MVKTLARMIWTTVRLGAVGTAFTCPAASRCGHLGAAQPQSGGGRAGGA